MSVEKCICIYCSAISSNKYNLLKHQQTKKCMSRQEEYRKNQVRNPKNNNDGIENYKTVKKVLEKFIDENKNLKETLLNINNLTKSKDTEILNLKLQLMRYSTLLTTYETELKEVKEWKNNIIKELEKKPSSKKIIKKLSLILRTQVWNRYIGLEKGLLKCPYCITHNISQLDFECGHIISRENNGSDDLSNLRPICNKCNKSLGKETLDIKKWDDGYAKQFDPVIIFDE
jgi:5-methylcytosine-specific restriction endonuclease McrA